MLYPRNPNLFFNFLKLGVASHNFSVVSFSQGGGEAIGIRHFMKSFNLSGFFGKSGIHDDDIDGKISYDFFNFSRFFRAAFPKHDVENFAVIDGAHEKILIFLNGL